MKTILQTFYKTIEEYYGVIFATLSEFKSQIFFMDLLPYWYIYSIHPP